MYIFPSAFLSVFFILSIKSEYSLEDAVIYVCDLHLLKEKDFQLAIPPLFSANNSTLNFRLTVKIPECPDGTLTSDSNVLNSGMSQWRIGRSGMLEGQLLTTGHNYADQYCIRNLNETSISILACRINCDNPITPCIPKCCAHDEGYYAEEELCQPLLHDQRQFRPLLHKYVNETHPPGPLSDLDLEQVRQHFLSPDCPKLISHFEIGTIRTDLHASEDGTLQLRLLEDGSIFVNSETTDWKWVKFPEKFGTVCVDAVPGQHDELKLIGLSCDQESEDFNRKMEESNTTRGIVSQVHAVLMVICSVFLLATFAIYVLLWQKQNIHGWTVMSYVLSLFWMYILLAADKFMTGSGALDNVNKETSSLCWTHGFLAHFAFLSTFAWLTTINFDIWWKFRAMSPIRMKSREIRRYIFYTIFGFGGPLLVLVVGIILNSQYPDSKSTVALRYGVGRSCFLAEEAQGVYMYYPVGFLMLLNFAFFASTAVTICRHYKATENIHDSKTKQQRESFQTILKLCIVMGVCWLLELLSYLFCDDRSGWNGGSTFWSVLDCFNIVQPLGIFFIFVWKRQILTQLWQLHPSLRPVLSRFEGLPGCRRSGVDCHSSTRMTTKSSHKSFQRSRSRKGSLGNSSTMETIQL